MADTTKKDRLKEITDGIEQGIQQLFESERYAQYLRTMSRFHRYSVNNTMLIHMQRPDATLVAGFNKWRDQFERHVRKGEKGIQIIAPTPLKKKIETQKIDPDTHKPVLNADGTVAMEEKEVRIPLYKVVSVFDVSQTEGKPLPQLASDLHGDVKQYEVFMEALRRASPVPISIETMTASMDGYFDTEHQDIAIRKGISEVQTVSAVIHEITHAKLHNYEQAQAAAVLSGDTKEPPKKKDRDTEEVEAESVSYAVCQYYGIQTGENSFGYIATWSKGKELPELRASLELINKTANGLITDIDRHFVEICKERGIDLTAPEMAENTSPHNAAKLEQTAQPDTPERFASDFYDYMNGLYDAGLMDAPFSLDPRERTISDLTLDLQRGYSQEFRDWLNNAAKLTGAPSVTVMLERLSKLEQARDAALVFKIHANPRTTGEADRHFIQAYQRTEQETLIPREVVFVGTTKRCQELLKDLTDGVIKADAVRNMAALPQEQPEPPAQAQEVLYLLDDTAYLHIQATDTGLDSTFYDKATLRQTDGGQLDYKDTENIPDQPLASARSIICAMEGKAPAKVENVPLDMLETLLDAQLEPPPNPRVAELIEHFGAEDADSLPETPEQALDEYPMPDPALTVADLEKCGYLDGDLLPISKGRAYELMEQDLTIYTIQPDAGAEMAFDPEDLDAHGGIFAVAREEWQTTPAFQEAVADRLNHQPEREAAFLAYKKDCFSVYQLKEGEEFQGLREQPLREIETSGRKVVRENYDLVYTGGFPRYSGMRDRLEGIFTEGLPADCQRPTLATGDIIVIKQGGEVTCHYCDSTDFVELPGFFSGQNMLRAAEDSLEQNDNQLDGLINNLPSQPTVAELEQQARSGHPISLMDLADAVHREQREKRPSVVEKLKQAPPQQERKKKAPSKGAEREI